MSFDDFLKKFYNGMTVAKYHSLSKWAKEEILKEYNWQANDYYSWD